MISYDKMIGYLIGTQVVIVDGLRGNYSATLNCWMIESDVDQCYPVDPWYHDWEG